MSFSGFWKHVGVGFATIGKYSLKGAKWASNNPQVFEVIAQATGHPEDAQIIAQVAPLAAVATITVK